MSSAPSDNAASGGAEQAKLSTPNYDLTHKIAPFLDSHLMLPMLQHVETLGVYNEEDIQQARLELVEKTNMMDFAISLYQELHGKDAPIPEDIENKSNQVLEDYNARVEAAMPVLELIDDGDNNLTEKGAELVNEGNFTREYLEEHFGVTEEHIEALYTCAKFKYECGDYDASANYLFHYRQLVPQDTERSLRALWGKFASEILSQQWDEADRDREKLRGLIYRMAVTDFGEEQKTGRARSQKKLMVLQQRSWLLHWSLYVFFNHEKGHSNLIEFFLQPDNLNAIQTNCPWLLRYLTTVLIASKRHQHDMFKLLQVIRQEKYTYRDPIIEFVEQLLVNFDFEAAQEKLKECDAVLRSDYFLSAFQDEDEFINTFNENARLFIFETYCRIHQKIDIGMLATKLSMEEDEAERWVVDMIRNAHFDARIDRQQHQVIMSVNYPSIYQQILTKTSDLSMRTRMLSDAVDSAVYEGKVKGFRGDRGAGRGKGQGGRGRGRGEGRRIVRRTKRNN